VPLDITIIFINALHVIMVQLNQQVE